MNTVFFVQNLDARELKVFGKKHQVRRYRMEHPNHQIIEREYQWHYKSELVTIMNALIKIGQDCGDYLHRQPYDETEYEDGEDTNS